MLAGSDVDAHRVAAEDLVAVRAHVDPVGVRIGQEVEAGRADEAAAVARVPDRDREALEVDGVAFEHVLHHGPARDLDRGQRTKVGEGASPEVEQASVRAGGLWQRERHRLSLGRGVGIDEDAVPAGVAGNVVEQDRRRTVGVVEHLGDLADALLPIDAADFAQLADLPDPLQPLARVGPRLDPTDGIRPSLCVEHHQCTLLRNRRCTGATAPPGGLQAIVCNGMKAAAATHPSLSSGPSASTVWRARCRPAGSRHIGHFWSLSSPTILAVPHATAAADGNSAARALGPLSAVA